MQVRKRFSHIRLNLLPAAALLLGVSLSVHSQKLSFENHTLKTGLPQNTINDIAQDEESYIWFATQVGAVRYDGYTYEVFNSSHGLPDDFIEDVMIASDGRIYFATEGGIGIYDGQDFQTLTEEDGLVDNRTKGMMEDLDGNIWAWSDYGLSVIGDTGIFNYTDRDALYDNIFVTALVDSKGRVHVSNMTDEGITIFNSPQSWEKVPTGAFVRQIVEYESSEIWYATQGMGVIVKKEGKTRRLGIEQGLRDETILCMYLDSRGRPWCGTYMEGLFIYENEQFKHFATPFDEEMIPAEIMEDSRGRMWITGFNDGVWLLDGERSMHILSNNECSEGNNLISNDVMDVFEDSFGSIWIGTLQGISKYGKAVFKIYDQGTGLPRENVQAVFHDSRGRTWIGAGTSLLYMKDDKLETLDEHDGFMEGNLALSFAEGRNGKIYIGTDDEMLFTYSGRSLSADMLGSSVNDILFATTGELWCATDEGIYIKRNNVNSFYDTLTPEGGLINPEVNSLLQCESGIYCATEGGISRFNPAGRHLGNLSRFNGLPSSACLDLACDYLGNLWVATKSGGISRITLENNEVQNLTIADGLLSNTTYFVEMADSIHLWVGTNRGISSVNTLDGKISNYSYEEGFYPMETNMGAISRGEDGEMWIGSVEGLVFYDPLYDTRDEIAPVLILFPPMVNGNSCTGSDDPEDGIYGEFPESMSFRHNQNDFEFLFTGIQTINPARNTFSWILEGFDQEWSRPGQARTASYPRLPKGHYTFHVKASNPNSVAEDSEAQFSFTVRPPYWEKIWFIALEILAGLLLIFGIFKYRERQLINEKRKLEIRVLERTREIQDQKVQIEAQRDEISAQKSYVEDQRDQIALINKEMTDSIHYAKRIQQAVLPGRITLRKTLPEHFIMFKPRDIVSGDYYWVDKREGKLIVCGADCTGHGVPGAFMSLLGLTFLNEIVNHEGVMKASEILNRLRDNIIRAMSHKDEDEQGKDGMDVSLVIIDQEKDLMEFSGAYNPLVLVRNGELIEYKGDKMPVGKHIGDELAFTNHRIELEEGDMIYLFSDGFPDQFGGEKGGKYKARPFRGLLQRISSEHVNSQIGLLEEEFEKWKGKEEQVDDVLVMGIRYVK